MKELDKMHTTYPDAKALIFSNFTQTLNLLKKKLDEVSVETFSLIELLVHFLKIHLVHHFACIFSKASCGVLLRVI
jgi:hypothetical protein